MDSKLPAEYVSILIYPSIRLLKAVIAEAWISAVLVMRSWQRNDISKTVMLWKRQETFECGAE